MTEDRVAVVTGAGNGLGRAEAMLLASQGFRVVVNDLGTSADGEGRSAEPADAVVSRIRDADGVAVANYDSVADEPGAERIVACAMDAFGRLDVLVNNAGVIRNRPLAELDTDTWDLLLKTHLYGTFYCTRAASEVMREQRYGRIVCTSSHIGLAPSVALPTPRPRRASPVSPALSRESCAMMASPAT